METVVNALSPGESLRGITHCEVYLIKGVKLSQKGDDEHVNPQLVRCYDAYILR